jgi:hypothetical protein
MNYSGHNTMKLNIWEIWGGNRDIHKRVFSHQAENGLYHLIIHRFQILRQCMPQFFRQFFAALACSLSKTRLSMINWQDPRSQYHPRQVWMHFGNRWLIQQSVTNVCNSKTGTKSLNHFEEQVQILKVSTLSIAFHKLCGFKKTARSKRISLNSRSGTFGPSSTTKTAFNFYRSWASILISQLMLLLLCYIFR